MSGGRPIDPKVSDIYRGYLELLGQHMKEMNAYLIEVDGALSNADFSHLKLMVGKVIGHGHMPVQEEILQKYPAAKPDWMKF